jgi:DNA-binding CsgD family transcriptional regulator
MKKTRSPLIMPKPSPMPKLSAALHEQLHEPMHALHAALEVEALWKAVQRLLRAAVPAHRVTLFLGHLGMGEARVVLTDPPIENLKEWYAERGKDNPFTPFIDAHRGTKFYRFEDVLPPRAAFARTEFYKNFAKPEGWDKGVSFVFWTQREVSAMFSLYRSPKEPVISDAEMAVLHYLYPFIGTAIDRVQKLHTERLARRSLEEFNKNIPVGLVFLEWDLRVEFANYEGQKACAVWNYGPAGARALNPRDAFAVPGPVKEACERLREAVQSRNPKQLQLLPTDMATLMHPAHAGLRAQITVLNNTASALAKPRFLVIFDTRVGAATEGESAVLAPPERMSSLRELSPREREIALLVCEGHSNAEIAQRLSKSVLTIKTQLNSVFRKLGVASRAKLMTLLR